MLNILAIIIGFIIFIKTDMRTSDKSAPFQVRVAGIFFIILSIILYNKDIVPLWIAILLFMFSLTCLKIQYIENYKEDK